MPIPIISELIRRLDLTTGPTLDARSTRTLGIHAMAPSGVTDEDRRVIPTIPPSNHDAPLNRPRWQPDTPHELQRPGRPECRDAGRPGRRGDPGRHPPLEPPQRPGRRLGAMQFLEFSPRERRRLDLDELLLMLARMALLALVAFALARPFWSPRPAGASSANGGRGRRPRATRATRRDVVLVLDGSTRMARRGGGTTPRDRAIAWARGVRQAARAGRLGRPSWWPGDRVRGVVDPPSFDLGPGRPKPWPRRRPRGGRATFPRRSARRSVSWRRRATRPETWSSSPTAGGRPGGRATCRAGRCSATSASGWPTRPRSGRRRSPSADGPERAARRLGRPARAVPRGAHAGLAGRGDGHHRQRRPRADDPGGRAGRRRLRPCPARRGRSGRSRPGARPPLTFRMEFAAAGSHLVAVRLAPEARPAAGRRRVGPAGLGRPGALAVLLVDGEPGPGTAQRRGRLPPRRAGADGRPLAPGRGPRP